jgi:hypothetical protein
MIAFPLLSVDEPLSITVHAPPLLPELPDPEPEPPLPLDAPLPLEELRPPLLLVDPPLPPDDPPLPLDEPPLPPDEPPLLAPLEEPDEPLLPVWARVLSFNPKTESHPAATATVPRSQMTLGSSTLDRIPARQQAQQAK